MKRRAFLVATGLLALIAPVTAMAARTPEPAKHVLILTGVGRFAVFADFASVTPDGDGVRMRAFQVSEPGFTVGDQAYWGGWSWWRFDCSARMVDRLDFAAVKAGGEEGPAAPDPTPPYAVAPGGDADELAAVACRGAVPIVPDAYTLEDAVRIGHARLSGEED